MIYMNSNSNIVFNPTDNQIQVSNGSVDWHRLDDFTSIAEKYFDVQGDVRNHHKEFVEIISKLPGIDDNFKTTKLYILLRDGKHDEFKKNAQKWASEYHAAHSNQFFFKNDPDTGIYFSQASSLKILTGGK